MDIKEMFGKMRSGEVQVHSELGNRDESKQVRNFGARIQKMKTVTGINARMLCMKDLVLPFNPFTCEADDTYNRKTPFRPILLVSQSLQGIKDIVLADADLRQKYNTEYDITFTDDAEVTLEDYQSFKKAGFIFPRVMTYYTVALNFGGICGFSEFRQKYMVDPTQLNDEGNYDYGPAAPIWHQAAIFFNGMLRPEFDATKKSLEENGATKEQISTQRQAIFAKSPVGFVGPTNLIPFFYFPMGEPLKKLDPKNPRDVESLLRFYSFTDKWVVPLKDARENPMYDTDIDFYDFTVRTPSSSEQKSNGQVYTDDDSMELYTAMQITNTDGRLALHGGFSMVGDRQVKNEEVYASFFEAARAYFAQSQEQSMLEDGETFEKVMAMSNRFRPITTVMDNFLPACNEVFNNTFATSKYFTEEIKKANSGFFTAMNPANAVALADSDDEELEEAAEAQGKSVRDLIASATPEDPNGADLSALEFTEE